MGMLLGCFLFHLQLTQTQLRLHHLRYLHFGQIDLLQDCLLIHRNHRQPTKCRMRSMRYRSFHLLARQRLICHFLQHPQQPCMKIQKTGLQELTLRWF